MTQPTVRGDGVDKGTREFRRARWLAHYAKRARIVYCPMSEESHKMAGMARKLVVTAADKPAAPLEDPR